MKEEHYCFTKHPNICAGKARPEPHTNTACAGERDVPCGKNLGYCGGTIELILNRLIEQDLPIGETVIEKKLIEVFKIF